jgi:catechol 2,3-dioxygenase-like lactoylglutathione lyase family enzyme
MSRKVSFALAGFFLPLSLLLAGEEVGHGDAEPRFTGETLTLLYVRNVEVSVLFYRSLGFELDFFYDYKDDSYHKGWLRDYPPEYAEVVQTGVRVGLTTTDEGKQVYGGGVRHYFIVDDVQKAFQLAQANGILASPNEVEERPWMRFFTVSDPDHHQIVIGTKNQVYYDAARARIEALRP